MTTGIGTKGDPWILKHGAGHIRVPDVARRGG